MTPYLNYAYTICQTRRHPQKKGLFYVDKETLCVKSGGMALWPSGKSAVDGAK